MSKTLIRVFPFPNLEKASTLISIQSNPSKDYTFHSKIEKMTKIKQTQLEKKSQRSLKYSELKIWAVEEEKEELAEG